MVSLYDESYKYIYVNPAAERIMGFTLEEFKNMYFWDCIHPDEQQAAKTRGIARLHGEDIPKAHYFRLVTKSGEVITIQVFSIVRKTSRGALR
jgi:PAS domain S-box-containing protein